MKHILPSAKEGDTIQQMYKNPTGGFDHQTLLVFHSGSWTFPPPFKDYPDYKEGETALDPGFFIFLTIIAITITIPIYWSRRN